MSWTKENGIDTLTTAVESGYEWFVFDNIVRDPADKYGGILSVDVYGDEDPTAPLTQGFVYLPSGSGGWLVNTWEPHPDRKPFKVTSGDMRKARDKILNEVGIRSDLRAQVASHGDDYDIDADAADCMLQALVFGKLVYG